MSLTNHTWLNHIAASEPFADLQESVIERVITASQRAALGA